MPFYGLCYRLDVTSTHQSSDSRAWCLRTSDLGFTRRPVTHAPACAGHDEIHVDAGLPLPEAPTPSGVAVGAAITSYVPIRPPDDEVACAGADKRPERACSATREPDGWAADIPCRTAARPTRGRDGATAPRTNPLAVRQHRAVVSPERLPSMNPRSARRLIQPTSSSEPPLLLWLRRRCAASNPRSRTRCVR